jgi:predicted PurR-regulated permease PerM
MTSSFKIPFYARLSLILVGGYVFVYILYTARQIIVPLIYATIIAILLNPIVVFLEDRKVKRLLAISLAILIAIVFTVGLFYLISSQVTMFEKTFPKLEQKFSVLVDQFAANISAKFDIDPVKVNKWIAKTRAELISNGNTWIGQTLITITGLLIVIFLIPVYIFMILYYKPLLLAFFRQLFDKIHKEKVEEVLFQTRGIIQSYLIGLLVEAVIIATLNSVALLILGIDYAILLGIMGALLNVIPFIGGILAVIMPMVISLITKDSSTAILVLLSYLLIQFFDNHYVTPKIVASKVKVNALMAVIVVLFGNALWGIPGMFLAIPLAGILKVIFAHIDELRPWSFLLGDAMPTRGRFIIHFPKRRQKNTDRA